MGSRDAATEAAVYDFVCAFERDRETGTVLPLTEYLSRYPGHADAVAAEYLELTREPDAPGPGAQQLGPFRLLSELGRGGQGTVWLAEDTRLGRQAAVKVLGGLVTEERRARLRREAEAVARLEHEGICAIYEADVDAELPWVAMRLVEGGDLSEELERAREPATRTGPWVPRDRTELSQVLLYFERAARALHAAHLAGVVHRDVKPGNLRVTPEGRPVVLDFGLAQDAEPGSEALTMTGEVFGTPAYMAPEQVRAARDIGPTCDVFSLAASLFEALTGERPFAGPNTVALMHAILSAPVPNARQLNPVVPEDVQVILGVALEKQPARRYASALAFAEDLRRVREFEPIEARPAGAGLRLLRFMQREPVLATAIGGIFVALATGLIVALVYKGRAEEKANLALGRLLTDRVVELTREAPAVALALGVEALELAPGHRSRSVLYEPLAQSRLRARLELDRAFPPKASAVAVDGKTVGVLAGDGNLHRFRVEDGGSLSPVPLGARKGVESGCVVAGPDGSWIVGWDDGDVVRVTQQVEWRAHAVSPVVSLAVSEAAGCVAVQRMIGPPQLLDLVTGEVRGVLKNGGAAFEGQLEFSDDGTLLLTSGFASARGQHPNQPHGRSTLWSVDTGERVRTFGGPVGTLSVAGFDADCRRVFAGGEDGTVRLWHAASGELEREPLIHPESVHRVALSTDGAWLASSMGQRLWLWDLATDSARELVGHEGKIQHLAFVGGDLVSAARDMTVRRWDVTAGEEIRECRAYVRPVTFHVLPDERTVVVESTMHFLHVFDLKQAGPVFQVPGRWQAAGFGDGGGELLLTDFEERSWRQPLPGSPEDAAQVLPPERCPEGLPELPSETRLRAMQSGADVGMQGDVNVGERRVSWFEDSLYAWIGQEWPGHHPENMQVRSFSDGEGGASGRGR